MCSKQLKKNKKLGFALIFLIFFAASLLDEAARYCDNDQKIHC
jgi:hypothetical protein